MTAAAFYVPEYFQFLAVSSAGVIDVHSKLYFASGRKTQTRMRSNCWNRKLQWLPFFVLDLWNFLRYENSSVLERCCNLCRFFFFLLRSFKAVQIYTDGSTWFSLLFVSIWLFLVYLPILSACRWIYLFCACIFMDIIRVTTTVGCRNMKRFIGLSFLPTSSHFYEQFCVPYFGKLHLLCCLIFI